MEKAVVVLSGGMDSTTLLWDVVASNKHKKIYALSINYGQRHSKELSCAAVTCSKLNIHHKIVDMASIGNSLLSGSSLTSDVDVPEGHYEEESMRSTVVPNRNMILISLAVGYAVSLDAGTVYYGAHAGDHAIYPDCRKEFVTAMQEAIKLCDWKKVRLEAPYIDIDKGDIVIIGKQIGMFDACGYTDTWTCYKGLDKACGKCGACSERILAFHKAEVVDPVEYEKPWEEVLADAKLVVENNKE